MDEFRDRLPTWPRWGIMLPAALLASAAVQLIVAILSGWDQTILSWLPNWAIQLVNAVVSGFVFVYVAAWVAPSGKVVVAVCVTVLVAVIAGLALASGLLLPTKAGPLMVVAGSLLTLLGAGAACYGAYEEQEQLASSQVRR